MRPLTERPHHREIPGISPSLSEGERSKFHTATVLSDTLPRPSLGTRPNPSADAIATEFTTDGFETEVNEAAVTHLAGTVADRVTTLRDLVMGDNR